MTDEMAERRKAYEAARSNHQLQYGTRDWIDFHSGFDKGWAAREAVLVAESREALAEGIGQVLSQEPRLGNAWRALAIKSASHAVASGTVQLSTPEDDPASGSKAEIERQAAIIERLHGLVDRYPWVDGISGAVIGVQTIKRALEDSGTAPSATSDSSSTEGELR